MVGRLELPADVQSVRALRVHAREIAAAAGADRAVVHAVELAVTEAATNAVLHAFLDRPPGCISVEGEAGRGRLRFWIRDDGRGMQPRADSPGAGLGLSTMGRLATSMDVRDGHDGCGTEIVLTFDAPGVEGPFAGADLHENELLDRTSRLARSAAWPDEGVERLADLLAGTVADVVTVDVLYGGILRRLSARVAGEQELSEWLAGSLPPARPGTATWSAIRNGGPRLVIHDPSVPRAPGGVGERLDLNWWLAVPLDDRAGETLGLLGLGGRGDRRPPTDREQALIREIAERAAGGLAHAGAIEGLRATRHRLEQVLGALDEAVVVRRPGGDEVFANPAANRLRASGALADVLVAAPPPGGGPVVVGTHVVRTVALEPDDSGPLVAHVVS